MGGPVPLLDFEQSKLKTSYCIDLHTRDRQVTENTLRVRGRLEPHPDRPTDEKIAVVCYGPSLEQTWEEIRDFKYIITCSGAHKFLLDRGIVPTWHCEVDPRAFKAELIGTPHKDVEYLVANVVHRDVLDLLEGHNVKIWHVFAHEASRSGVPLAYNRGEWALTGGSNIGMRALVIARFMGFRNLVVYGMDFSFKNDGSQHAGWHPKEIPNIHAVEVDGKTFFTNVPMHTYAQSFFHEVEQLGKIELTLRGEGMMQALAAQRLKNPPPPSTKKRKRPVIASQTPQVMSASYLELSRKMHETNAAYGISGSKRTEVVQKLIAAVKPGSILDYGCGKGTLAMSLDRPIWEYDPAIPGKDTPPRPADLVICTDVLEHVEPEFIGNVLLDLARVTLKVGYLLIHTGPAQKTLPDGRNTHLLQKPASWWTDTLSGFFEIAKVQENGMEVSYIVGPKKGGIGTKAVKPQPVPVGSVAMPDLTNRITPARYKGTEVKFRTPNEKTVWRAQSLFTKEPCTIDWIETFKDGEVLWDIGANVGGYSVWAAVRKGVKVVAFEPEKLNFDLLTQNLELNGDIEAVVMNVALSDVSKEDKLYLGEADTVGGSCNTFGAQVGPFLKPREAKGVQDCVAVTIDDLVKHHNIIVPTHIKIDVDGQEHLVLRGAVETLKNPALKSMLVEVNTNLQEHQEMLRQLRDAGFVYDPAQAEKALRKDGPFKGCGEFIFTRAPVKEEPKPVQCETPIMDLGDVERHVLQQISRTAVRNTPYDHMYVENLFPAPFYEQMLRNLPAKELYRSLGEARHTDYPDRFVCDLQASSFWAALEARLRAGGLRFLLGLKFRKEYHGQDECLLMRDRAGYKIGPHTDTPAKAATMLVYLPSDLSLIDYGTSVYEPIKPGFEDPEGRHRSPDEFKEVWRAPFAPNSAFIFARTNNSFHGVSSFDVVGKERNILLYDIRSQ